jgi:cysteinyl-tRNA synthetase
MAEWVGEARAELSEQAQAFGRRFRDAVADDLDMPQALVVLNEMVASGAVGGGEKYALLAAWDSVLGLDLDRLARTVTRRVSQGVDISVVVTDKMDLTDQVETLVRQRDEARRAKDFVAADEIRKKLIALGFEVMDTSEGTKVRPQS